MDTSQLGQAAIGLGVIIAGSFTGVQSFRARKQAARAAENSHPISNGWGTALRSDMAKVVASMERMHGRMDENDRRQNLQDEQLARTNRVAEQAADHARTGAEQSAAVATGLAAHLADHASTAAQGIHVEVTQHDNR